MEKLNKRLKGKKYVKLLAMMGALAITLSAVPFTTAEAAESATTTTFDKYLVMKQDSAVPNASFSFAITAGQAKTYDIDGKKFEILPGVTPEKVTMAGVGTTDANKIAFANGDETSTAADANVKDFDAATEKYAKKTATLDFSQVAYTEPGVYRYVLTESGTNQGITNDADATRIIDVYVFNQSTTAGTNNCYIAGYVLHSNANDTPDVSMGDENGTVGSYEGVKSQGFTNSYATQNLVVAKEVKGNQASKDKYFEFTLNITEAVPGTVYALDLSDADQVSGSNGATIAANAGKQNPTSITIRDDGTATQKLYLKDGQSIKVNGISQGVKYAVTENAEDYKQSMSADSDAANGTVADADLNVEFTNTRNGIIPTGVVMTVVPFAAVMLIGGAGATIVMKKKREDDEE